MSEPERTTASDPIVRIAEALERIADSLESATQESDVSGSLDSIYELLASCIFTYGRNNEHAALRISDIGD